MVYFKVAFSSNFIILLSEQGRVKHLVLVYKVCLHLCKDCGQCRYNHKLMELVHQVLAKVAAFTVDPDRFQVCT